MLSLQLKSGEYLTIGEDIAVQIFEQSGSTFRVSIKAPREVPILRSDILEQQGKRPEGLLDKRPKSPSDRARDARRIQELERRRAHAAAERQQTAALQNAVTQELLAILGEADTLLGDRADTLRDRLHAVQTALTALD